MVPGFLPLSSVKAGNLTLFSSYDCLQSREPEGSLKLTKTIKGCVFMLSVQAYLGDTAGWVSDNPIKQVTIFFLVEGLVFSL